MGFVDVARAVAASRGLDVPLSPHSRDLHANLVSADHLVFLLADGLGMDFIEAMSRQSWLRRHTRRAIHAPFPSTTTSAVTSFATAEYPALHAITGWWVHLAQLNAPATVFAHDRATDGRPLDRLGVDVSSLFGAPPIIATLHCAAAAVIPEGIVESPYTRYIAGGTPCLGYRTYSEAVEHIAGRVRDAAGPTFTYWYTPSPDAEAHDEGITGQRIPRTLAALDEAVASLARQLEETGRTWRIVATADHGHLELDPRLELTEGDALLQHVTAPPAGDMRVQFWHARPGSEAAFEATFRQRFGNHFFLLSAAELEELALLGPIPWGVETRRRSGTHVSISRGRASLRYAGFPGRAGYRRMRSGHSGLSPAEMLVPLIIAGDGLPGPVTPDAAQ